jgi:hypothetical protein
MGVYETRKLCINGLQLFATIQINAIFNFWTSDSVPCYESTASIIILVNIIQGDYLESSKQIRKIIQSSPISTPDVQ